MKWPHLRNRSARASRPHWLLDLSVCVPFLQHCPEISRARDQKAGPSIAGPNENLYKFTAGQVSVAGICELRIRTLGWGRPQLISLAVTQSLGGGKWDQLNVYC